MTSRFLLRFAKMPVYEVFDKLDASEFQQPRAFFLPPIERHAHLPRTREHFLVVDRGFPVQMVRASGRDPFNHVHRVAVKVPGPIEPAEVVESRRVDDERDRKSTRLNSS